MVIVRLRLVNSIKFHFTMILHCSSNYYRLLHCAVKKKLKHKSKQNGRHVTRFRGADQTKPSAGSWNLGWPGLMVTKQPTQLTGYPGHGEIFLVPHNRSRSNFRFWKREWRHPRRQTEVAPAPFMREQKISLHYCQTGQPLSKPIMALFADVYMRHSVSMS